jgi:hypothetical protein
MPTVQQESRNCMDVLSNNAAVFWDIFTAVTMKIVRMSRLHGGDYEECRPLEYKNPLRTSQETHYVSATEPSRSMLWKI